MIVDLALKKPNLKASTTSREKPANMEEEGKIRIF
jgi:hypothetical protein